MMKASPLMAIIHLIGGAKSVCPEAAYNCAQGANLTLPHLRMATNLAPKSICWQRTQCGEIAKVVNTFSSWAMGSMPE